MKFIVMVLTLYLLCEDVQADVAASGLNSVGLPDVALRLLACCSSLPLETIIYFHNACTTVMQIVHQLYLCL